MSFAVLGLNSRAPVVVDDARPVATSFPGFVAMLESARRGQALARAVLFGLGKRPAEVSSPAHRRSAARRRRRHRAAPSPSSAAALPVSRSGPASPRRCCACRCQPTWHCRWQRPPAARSRRAAQARGRPNAGASSCTPPKSVKRQGRQPHQPDKGRIIERRHQMDAAPSAQCRFGRATDSRAGVQRHDDLGICGQFGRCGQNGRQPPAMVFAAVDRHQDQGSPRSISGKPRQPECRLQRRISAANAPASCAGHRCRCCR